jgi:hypothetical protein
MPGPSNVAEAIVAFFLPAARREEVLGDLHERYRSPGQYAWEAIRVILCVGSSEISRKGGITMNVKTLTAIMAAFMIGWTAGFVMQPNHIAVGSFFPNAIPFLVLLLLWVVLMAIKFTRPKPKC